MLWLVTLMNVRSHVIANAAISPYRKGEILASEFIHSLPDKSVILLDKGFRCRPVAAYSGSKTPTVTGSSRNARLVYTELSAMATVTVCCNDGLASG